MHNDPLSIETLQGLDDVEAELEARNAFEASEAIRAEFGALETAIAYAKAAARGLVRVREQGAA